MINQGKTTKKFSIYAVFGSFFQTKISCFPSEYVNHGKLAIMNMKRGVALTTPQ